MSTDTVVVNVDLMRRVLEHITAHRSNWDQFTWGKRSSKCGTSHCAGGWAVALSGLEIEWVTDGLNPDWEWGNWVKLADGNDKTVRTMAMELLGLTQLQADAWFETTRSVYYLWTLAAKWTNGEIEVPESVKPGFVPK